MTDLPTLPSQHVRFDLTMSRQWVIELATLDRTPEDVRTFAARVFDTQNPECDTTQVMDIIAKALGTSQTRLQKHARHLQNTDAVETVITAQMQDKPHRLYRIAGIGTALLTTALVAPLVMVVSAGVHESLLIERVVDAPWQGLAYGTAPLGGLIAGHSLRETCKTDAAQRWFDRAVYGTAIGVFALWANSFGPVFLSDPLSGGFGVLGATKDTLANWYRYHLAMEFTGGVAAYSAFSHLLTHGARKVTRANPEAEALQEKLVDETSMSMTLATQHDTLSVRPRHREAARAVFQDRAVQKVEVARQLLAARSATDTVTALAEVMRDWKDFDTEEPSHD